MVYLEKILGTKVKVRLLFTLISNSAGSYMEKELAKDSNTSISEVNRQVADLVNAGVIIMQRAGSVKTYSINKKHVLFAVLRPLFTDLNRVYRKIAQKIKSAATAKFACIRAIIIAGSLTRGNVREDIVKEPSDIDLVFILENDKDLKEVRGFLLRYIDEKIFPQYGITLFPFVISRREFLERLGGRDPFIAQVHTTGEVVYGEKPRRFS